MIEFDLNIVLEEGSIIPEYQSELASGADIHAKLDRPINLKAGESVLVPTGIYIEIPEGFEIQIRPRSGLALKHQITVLNSPGTIDSDYRGQIKIILINHGKNNFVIEDKMRIAQLVLSPVARAKFLKKPQLSYSTRGISGFGHTGY